MGLTIGILNWLGLWVVCVQNSGGLKTRMRGIECPAIEWAQSIIGRSANINNQKYWYIYYSIDNQVNQQNIRDVLFVDTHNMEDNDTLH